MSEQTREVIQLGKNLRLDVVEDGRYITYTLTNDDHQSIDLYIDDVLDRLKVWESGKMYVLHDLSSPHVSLTRYFQKRLDDVSAYLRESQKSGYSAVILPNTFMSHFISIFAQMFNRKNGSFDQRIFTSLESGQAWIADGMAKETASTAK